MSEIEFINEKIEDIENNIKKVDNIKVEMADNLVLFYKPMDELQNEISKNIVNKKHIELTGMKKLADDHHMEILHLEDWIIQDQSANNIEINSITKDYNDIDQRYKLGKNTNSARGIRKIDSYDKNIEENVFIMYYLLSFGVLGYFMYKLIKL
jgi:hypothetical protein